MDILHVIHQPLAHIDQPLPILPSLQIMVERIIPSNQGPHRARQGLVISNERSLAPICADGELIQVTRLPSPLQSNRGCLRFPQLSSKRELAAQHALPLHGQPLQPKMNQDLRKVRFLQAHLPSNGLGHWSRMTLVNLRGYPMIMTGQRSESQNAQCSSSQAYLQLIPTPRHFLV